MTNILFYSDYWTKLIILRVHHCINVPTKRDQTPIGMPGFHDEAQFWSSTFILLSLFECRAVPTEDAVRSDPFAGQRIQSTVSSLLVIPSCTLRARKASPWTQCGGKQSLFSSVHWEPRCSKLQSPWLDTWCRGHQYDVDSHSCGDMSRRK